MDHHHPQKQQWDQSAVPSAGLSNIPANGLTTANLPYDILSQSNLPPPKAATWDASPHNSFGLLESNHLGPGVAPIPNNDERLTAQQQQQEGSNIDVGGDCMEVDNRNDLQQQIQFLREQLNMKDQELFDVHSSLATVEAEAAHRAATAEREAERKVRIVEDELRRVQNEADAARASLARFRKKSSSQPDINGSLSENGPRIAENGGISSSRSLGSFHAREENEQLESKNMQSNGNAITPNLVAHENHDGHDQIVLGTQPIADPRRLVGSRIVTPPITATTPSQSASTSTSPTRVHASHSEYDTNLPPTASQRLALQILGRWESLTNTHDWIKLPDEEPEKKQQHSQQRYRNSVTKIKHDEEVSTKRQLSDTDQRKLPKISPNHQFFFTENEEEASIKAILLCMATTSHNRSNFQAGGQFKTVLSIEGLVREIMSMIIAQFRVSLGSSRTNDLPTMRPHTDKNEEDKSESGPLKQACDSRVLDGNLSLEASSWRTVLVLLRLLAEVLLSSAGARSNLRSWLAKNNQTQKQSHAVISTSRADKLSSASMRMDDVECRILKGPIGQRKFPNIVALTAKNIQETLSQPTYTPRAERELSWNEVEKAAACTNFVVILSDLMAGNSFKREQMPGYISCPRRTSLLSSEKEISVLSDDLYLYLMSQKMAMRIFLILTSDATSSDECHNLWSLWFDSLFFTRNRSVTNMPSEDSRKQGNSQILPKDSISSEKGQSTDKSEQHRNTNRRDLVSFFCVCTMVTRHHPHRLQCHDIAHTKQQHDSSGLDSGQEEFNGTVSHDRKDSDAHKKEASTPRRRGNKTSRVERGDGKHLDVAGARRKHLFRLLIENKSAAYQVVLRLLSSSRSLRYLFFEDLAKEKRRREKKSQTIPRGKFKSSLARRLVALTLDELEGSVLSRLSSGVRQSPTKEETKSNRGNHLDSETFLCLLFLGLSIVRFFMFICQTPSGFDILRLQMKLEGDECDEHDRATSGIGVITEMLDLIVTATIRNPPFLAVQDRASTAWSDLLKETTALLFQMLHHVQARQEEKEDLSKAKDEKGHRMPQTITLASIVSEHKEIFTSCCHLISISDCDGRNGVKIDDATRNQARLLAEEISLDEDEIGDGPP